MDSNVERRYFGSFGATESADEDMLAVEDRDDSGVKRTYIVGYAARFGVDSVLLGDFIERIDPSAFDILKEGKDGLGKPIQTRGLFNHDPNHLLGRYPSTMKLTVDEKGLKYEILLPETRQDIAEMVRRGDLRGSSFSFVVADGGEKWHYEKGQSIRTVKKIKTLVDCGPVTYPAYDSSSCAIAQRSHQQFVAKHSERMEKRNALMSRLTAELAKGQEFIAERRGGDCGRDADGKFSSGNSCASALGGATGDVKKDSSGGTLKKIASDTATGAAVGALAQAGVNAAAGAAVGGTIGNIPGAITGAAVGALSGLVPGALAGGATAGGVSAAEAVGSKVASSISPSTKQNQLVNLGGAVAGFIAGGVPGAIAGAAITSAGQGVFNKLSGGQREKLEATKKSLGVSNSRLKAAQKILDKNSRGESSGKVNAWTNNDGKVHMFDDAARNHITVSKVGEATNAHVDLDWAVAGTSAPKAIREAGKALGVNRVSTEVPSNDAGDVMAGMLKKSGFREDKSATGNRSGSRVFVKGLSRPKAAKRFDQLVEFFIEKRTSNECGREDDGKFGSGNNCQGGGVGGPAPKADLASKQPGGVGGPAPKPDLAAKYGSAPPAGGAKYMEWKKGKDHKSESKTKKAQDFVDAAREDQLSKGGKDGGKADDGGGVQTWSKGENFPWTVSQKGDVAGYIQGVHPDGSKTKKYDFADGDTAEAYKKVSEEIKAKPKKRSFDHRRVIAETMQFLKERRA
jgi:HK97 family phage prohead protease